MHDDGRYSLQSEEDVKVQDQQADGSDDRTTARGKSIFQFSFFQIPFSSITMLRL